MYKDIFNMNISPSGAISNQIESDNTRRYVSNTKSGEVILQKVLLLVAELNISLKIGLHGGNFKS